jgi:hypothetical protein
MYTLKRRRKFDREFKLETVRLITEGGRSVAEVDNAAIFSSLLLNRLYLLCNHP